MPRATPILALLFLYLACATGGLAAWERASERNEAAPPKVGASFPGVIAALFAPTGTEGDRIEVRELRVLAMSERPWRELEPGEVASTDGLVGLLTHRICRRRDGLEFTREERSSWMIFEHGALIAYDHGHFAGGCAAERWLRPAPKEKLGAERGLLRYTAQRYPAARPTLEERLQGGVALVEVGRLDDAERLARLADPRIAELEDRTEILFDQQKARSEERLRVVKALRAKLVRALRAARKAEREEAEAVDGP